MYAKIATKETPQQKNSTTPQSKNSLVSPYAVLEQRIEALKYPSVPVNRILNYSPAPGLSSTATGLSTNPSPTIKSHVLNTKNFHVLPP